MTSPVGSSGRDRPCEAASDELSLRSEKATLVARFAGFEPRYSLSLGLRALRRSPGHSLVAVVVLALGIGATTTMIGVVDAVLLRPLPYPEPDRLVQIWGQDLARDVPFYSVAYPDVAAWREASQTLDPICAFQGSAASLSTGGEAESVAVVRGSWELLPMLGTVPAAGRLFHAAEDVPERPKVAILAHALAVRHFGTAAAAVGAEVVLDGGEHLVVGVLPVGFRFPTGESGLFLPLAESAVREQGRRAPTVSVYARLADGRSRAEAQAELDELSRRLDEESPEHGRLRDVKVWGVHEFMTRGVRRSVVICAAAVVLVLAVACLNVANLLLARATRRRRELAVRAVLGASRGQLVRQLLVECGLLAAAGCLVGLALAWLGTWGLLRFVPSFVPLTDQVTMNGRMLGAALVVSVVTAFVFGLGPALSLSLVSPVAALRGSARSGAGTGSDRRATGLRRLLVVTELAVSTVLLVAAGLLLRTFLAMQAVDPGFTPSGVVTGSVTLRADSYAERAERIRFFGQMLETLVASPGVEAAGVTSALPLTGFNQGVRVVSDSGPITTGEDAPIVWFRMVSPGYFRALGIPLVRGRLLESPEPVTGAMLVNEAFAARFWPGEDPIGKRIGPAFARPGAAPGEAEEDWSTVVGVVGDVRHMRLTNPPDLELFFPYDQMTPSSVQVVVRTALAPDAAASTLAAAVAAADPGQAVGSPEPMDEALARALDLGRMPALLLGAFAGIAIVLAAVGLYGVISYSIGERTTEIGVRMALGADSGKVLLMVLREGLATATAGLAIGVAGALAATSLLRTMLFEVSARDPATFVVVTIGLLAVAMLAVAVPARRAAAVAPNIALRQP